MTYYQRLLYVSPCTRCWRDDDGVEWACGGRVSRPGWRTNGSRHEPPDGDYDGPWGACDECGATDWTEHEREQFERMEQDMVHPEYEEQPLPDAEEDY